MGDPFSILGISPDSSAEEIKAAYRTLARECHPDRFPEGPERNAAEEKMIHLNRAYEDALAARSNGAFTLNRRNRGQSIELDEKLSDARTQMARGQLDAARRTLTQADGRSAEWHYIYGAILMRLGDFRKAAVYFAISKRMMPENARYRAALRSAEALRDRDYRSPLQKLGESISRLWKKPHKDE